MDLTNAHCNHRTILYRVHQSMGIGLWIVLLIFNAVIGDDNQTKTF